MDLKQLAAQMRKFAKRVPDNASTIVSKAAVASLQSVVSGTPVDTGRARGNWQMSRNDAAEGEINRTSAESAISAGTAVANTAGPGDSLHLSNNVAYINRLNNGSSQQAPAGFIEDSVRDAVDEVARVENEILKGL